MIRRRQRCSSSSPSTSFSSATHSNFSLLSSVHILLLVYSFLLPSISTLETFNVCMTEVEKERRRPSNFLHEGILVELSTGRVDGAIDDSRGKYCEIDLKLNKSHGERTEVSFVRHGLLDVDNCFEVIYGERGNSANKGWKEFPCTRSPSPSNYSVVFTRDTIDDLTLKIHDRLVDSQRANAAVFIQNRLVKADRIVLHRSAPSLSFECPHPNSVLRPNLYKRLEDLTPSLNGGRKFSVEFGVEKGNSSGDGDTNNGGAVTLSSLSGVYDCSWTPPPAPNAPPPTPRTSFDVNVYAAKTVCSITGVGSEGLRDAVSVDGMLEVEVADGSSIADVVVSCTLPWSGDDDTLRLRWKDLEAGVDVATLNDEDRKKISLSPKNEVNVTKTTSFECVVEDVDLFEGTRTPESCIVFFRPKEGPGEEQWKGGANIGFIALAIVVVVIIVVVFVVVLLLCKKRGKGADGDNGGKKSLWDTFKRKFCCCCGGVTHWGSYRTDNLSIAPSEATIDQMPPANPMWSDDKNDSISMDTDFNDSIVSRHPSLNSVAKSVESGLSLDPDGRSKSYRISQI